jgi:hypothetical protein
MAGMGRGKPVSCWHEMSGNESISAAHHIQCDFADRPIAACQGIVSLPDSRRSDVTAIDPSGRRAKMGDQTVAHIIRKPPPTRSPSLRRARNRSFNSSGASEHALLKPSLRSCP